ncbi:MAG: ABC transporter permease, partial [Planctomycetes bacterium]|nr:ABC transporter permease [Planctomycetota bacterium]
MAQLPFRYTLRNLLRRKTRTALTLLGMALVIGSVVFMLAFSRSLAATFRKTGDPDNLIIISKKARTFVLSSISAQNTDQIRNKFFDEAKTYDPAEGEAGRPIISPEVYIGLNVEVEDARAFRKGHQRAIVHGLDPEMGLAANESVKVVAGRLPRPDRMELMVGNTASTRIGVDDGDLAVDRQIKLLGRKWKIVGRFEAPGTIMDCEIWAP